MPPSRPASSRFPQPVPQRFEVARHRTKRPYLLGRLRPGRADQKARHERLLMTSRPQHRSMIACIHCLLPSGGDRDAAGTFETLPCVLPVPGRQEWHLYVARAGLPSGVLATGVCQPHTITRREAPTNRPAPPPFSPIMARPQALVESPRTPRPEGSCGSKSLEGRFRGRESAPTGTSFEARCLRQRAP